MEKFPETALVTEEQSNTHKVTATTFFIVDPLDGTKEFIKRRGEFTVNIALVENGVPTLGVVYAPALDRLFVAESRFNAWQASCAPGAPLPGPDQRRRLRIRSAPKTGLTAIASKSHRSAETNDRVERDMVSRLVELTGFSLEQIEFLLFPVPASHVMEGGAVLPEPGEEASWLAAHHGGESQ